MDSHFHFFDVSVANNEPLFVQCVGNIVASFREWIQAEGRTFDDAFFFAVENIVGDLVRDVAARYQGMSEEMQKILAELAAEPRQDEDMRAHRALPGRSIHLIFVYFYSLYYFIGT